MLAHFLQRYGHITPYDLDDNEKKLHMAFDPSIPIDQYFHNIDEVIQFAADGLTPFHPRKWYKRRSLGSAHEISIKMHVSNGKGSRPISKHGRISKFSSLTNITKFMSNKNVQKDIMGMPWLLVNREKERKMMK